MQWRLQTFFCSLVILFLISLSSVLHLFIHLMTASSLICIHSLFPFFASFSGWTVFLYVSLLYFPVLLLFLSLRSCQNRFYLTSFRGNALGYLSLSEPVKKTYMFVSLKLHRSLNILFNTRECVHDHTCNQRRCPWIQVY
jgi:hypothetical protein